MNDRTMFEQAFVHRQSPPFFHQQQSYTPHPTNFPQPHITPYELYAKPAQPLDWMNGGQNPPGGNANQAQAGMTGTFTDSNGQVDFDKTIATISRLASTYHQVSPIVKQLSSLLRMFRG